MKTDLRALLINANTCKTLYLNHLGSGAFIGDKVEVVAEYCSVGSTRNHALEGIVCQAFEIAGCRQRRMGGAVSAEKNET